MAQVRNTLTGMTLTIPDDQVPYMSSQWQVVSGQAAPAPAPAPVPAPVPAPSPAPTPAPAPSPAPTPQYGGMDQATVDKFMQAFGRTPTSTDIANWKYNPTVVNQQLDTAIAAKQPKAPAVPGTPIPGTAAQPEKSFPEMRQELKTMGINESALTDEQVGQIYAAKAAFDLQIDQDKQLPAQLTVAELNKFLEDAKTELHPYYQEQLKIGQQSIIDFFADITGDVEYKSTERLRQQEEERQKMAIQMAEAGLTFSGLRSEAERKQREQQQGLVRSEASAYAQKLREQARAYETKYGTEALRQLNVPALQYAGVEIAPPTQMGDMLGTQQKEEVTAERTRAGELAKQEMEKRFGMTYGTTPSF